MTKADYNDIITSLSNPDTVSDGLVRLSEKLLADEQQFSKLTESINNLRDTNAKLALRITTPVEIKEPEAEKTDEQLFDELFSSKFKED